MDRIWRVLYFIFVVKGSVLHEQTAMKGFILHQSHPSCHDVDANYERIPCTLSNQEDYHALLARDSNHPANMPNINCQDGSSNMTCLPLSFTPVRYYCACAAKKGDLNAGIGWNDTWELVSEPWYQRSLCDTQAGWCLIAMYKRKIQVNLVEEYAQQDSQIAVSSVLFAFYNVKVRFSYTGASCAWIRITGDVSPWIKFDFLQSRVAIGVVIGKRCDETSQFVTSFNVSTSGDDVTWSYVGTDVDVVYEGTLLFTWMFGMEVRARYWKIEPVTFHNFPAMQADFIGYNI